MPTLPASGYPTPQAPSIEALPVAPEVKQDIRATPEAFGMASALALTNLGQSFEKAAGYLGNIQDQYDKTVAQEARNRALAYSQRLLYGDPDLPDDRGFFGTEGRTSLDRRADTIKNLEDVYDKERRNLPTAQAQRLFDEGSAAGRLHNQALVLHHASQQFQKFKAKEAESEVGLKLNEVSSASTRGDLDAMKQNLGEAINIATQALRERGASDAEIKAKASDLTATAVEFWSLGRAPTDPTGALAALEQNKEHFTDPARYARLYGQVKGHADKEEGRKLVESTTGPGPTAGGDAVDRFLDLAAQHESGWRNIHQGLVPRAVSTAQGYFQITNTTWKNFAPPEVLAQYPNAMSAPYEVQRQVARNIVTTSGVQHWTDYNAALRASALSIGMPVSGPISGRPAQPTTTAGPVNWAPTTGPDGKVYMLTGPQAEEYKSIEKPEDQQKFLTEAVKTPVPPTPSAPAPTTPAPSAVPESPLAGQVARIQASGASPEVKEAAIAELNHQHQVKSLGQKEADYELTRAINRGDPSITPDYIDSLVQTQRISPADGTQAQARLEKVKEDQRKISDAIALVDSARRGETALDPTNTDHKKSVEIDFANASKGWKPAEEWSKSMDYVSKVNVVPERVKATITGNLFSGNEGRATAGARQYRELVALNPMLGESFNADARAMAATLNTMAGFGMVPKEAFTQAQAQMRVPQAEQEARRKSFDSVRGPTPSDQLAKDTAAINSKFNTWGDDPNEIPPAMLHEFRELARMFYGRTGNLDAAYQAAYDTARSQWSPSRVGADGHRWLKGAPEALYAAPGRTDNSDWMNQQLLADVNAAAPKPFTLNQLHIIPQVPEITKPGEKPGYSVWYSDEAGNWDTVRDANRTPLVWRPNWTTSEVRAKEAQALRQRHEERARAPVATAPVPPQPQPPLPGDATFLEKLKRAPSQLRELRSPAPSGTRPPPT